MYKDWKHDPSCQGYLEYLANTILDLEDSAQSVFDLTVYSILF